MTHYHDYRKFYRPVLNEDITNYNFPHHFKLQRHAIWGIAEMQYAGFAPEASWAFEYLPRRPPTAYSSIDKPAPRIPLSKYMLFNGEGEVLKALDFKAITKMRFDEVMHSSSNKNMEKLSTLVDALPFILEVERSALTELKWKADMMAEYDILPDSLLSSESMRDSLTVDEIKRMENAMETELMRENNEEAGYIIWLKRSKIEDRLHLDGRPDVLPNPKLWDTIISGADGVNATTSQPVEEALLTIDPEFQNLVHLLVVDIDPDDNNTTDAVARVTPPAHKANAAAAARPAGKSAAETEAKNRLLYLRSAAAQMVKSANYMLANTSTDMPLFKGLYDQSPFSNIIQVTNQFSEKVLSSTEMKFYEQHKTTERILRQVEQRALAAEAEPWELLRLPLSAPNLIARRELMLQKLAERDALGFESMRRVLDRRGHLSYNPGDEVINREGNMNAAASRRTEDINTMTKARLEILAKNANIRGRSKLKVNELREAIKKYLQENAGTTVHMLLEPLVEVPDIPEPLETAVMPAPTGTGATTVTTGTAVEVMVGSDISESCCCVMECSSAAFVTCALCNLSFCRDLHASHVSHRSQSLKIGYSFAAGSDWEARNNIVDVEALEAQPVTVTATHGPADAEAVVPPPTTAPQAIKKRVRKQVDSVSLSEPEALEAQPVTQAVTATHGLADAEAVVPPPTTAPEAIKKRVRKQVDSVSSAEPEVADASKSARLDSETSLPVTTTAQSLTRPHSLNPQLVTLALKLKELRASGVTDPTRFNSMLNFSTYTPAFLFELSDELGFELPSALRSKTRTGRDEVRQALIQCICL
jgi:hypothetical protein